MMRMIVSRLGTGIVVLLLVATSSFMLMKLAPGGPFTAERSDDRSIKAALDARYHLDESWPKQYYRYMNGFLKGDFGHSMIRTRSVNDIIDVHFWVSLKLGLWALAFAIFWGLFFGVVAASKQNTWLDHTSMSIALIGISMPSFVLGNLLIAVFAIHLGWFPVARFETWRYVILPASTLGMVYMGIIARLARTGMLETMRQDYIRTARAKGLSENRVVWKHAFRLGVMPVVTFLGPATAALVTGSFVVEKVFQVPGLGRYFIESALQRDLPVLAGLLVFYASFLIILNLLVDIAYGFLDPRIRGR